MVSLEYIYFYDENCLEPCDFYIGEKHSDYQITIFPEAKWTNKIPKMFTVGIHAKHF